MAAVLTQTHRRLPFGRLLKYGIVALVSLVAGYLIHFSSLPDCLVNDRQKHVSPNGTFTVTEYTSCYHTRISIVKNNQRSKITDDLAESNRNAYPYNVWFYCPCVTRFFGWDGSDTQFYIGIKSHRNKIEDLLAGIYSLFGKEMIEGWGIYEALVDAETGRIIEGETHGLL
jgi:hypothetical protein